MRKFVQEDLEAQRILVPSLARKLASGSFLRVGNFFAILLVSFFMMPFVVHKLGDRMYGFWTFVGTFLGYYGLLNLGLSSAVNRHIAGALGAENKDECNRVFNTGIILFCGIGFVALLVTGILAGLSQVIWRNPEDASLFWKVVLILGVNTAIDFPMRVFRGVLAARLRYDILTALQLVSLAFRTVLVVWVLISGYKILALACVTVLSGIPEMILIVYLSKKNMPFLKFDRRYWGLKTAKILFSYSSFTFIAQIADQLKFNVDAIVITAFISLAAVTHFNIAGQLVRYFISLMVAFLGVFEPVFSRQYGAGADQAMKTTFFFTSKISVYISSFIGFGLIVWGSPFIHVWMGPEYLDAYPCLVILVVGSLFDMWQVPSVSLLYSTSKHRFYALFNSIEGVCNLLLSLVLVTRYGIIGVALGTFVPMAIIKLLIQPIYVCRSFSIEYKEYALRMVKALIVVSLSLTAPLLISRYATPDYWVLGVVGFVSLCCYSLFIWFFGFSSREKRVWKKTIIAKQPVERMGF